MLTHTDEQTTSTDEHTTFLLLWGGTIAVDAWICFCILAFCVDSGGLYCIIGAYNYVTVGWNENTVGT